MSGAVQSFPIYEWECVETYTDGVSNVAAYYTIAGNAESQHTESIPNMNITIDLVPGSISSVVPGSVEFTMGGETYADIEGVIHRDIDPVTGVGVVSGSINYLTGVVTLNDWVAGDPAVVITSLLLELFPWLVGTIQGYTSLAPLRPASYTVAATTDDGELITATTDAEGIVSGTWIDGTVDVETGVVYLRFGQLLDDALLSDEDKAEPWYNAANVEGGFIWRPRLVWPETVRYNCVAYVYLPLSAEVLGINPVRLPMDGKVPLYRVGDVIVIHHTQETSVPTPIDTQVVDLGRVRIAWALVYDSAGDPVDTADYTLDLDAGTVTLDNITGYSAPLSITDRIEDMALVNDLQINGTLGITKALSHDYAADETYVSSALITSDLFARVTNVYAQTTWTSVWSDELIGDAPLSVYNDTAYPIEISNIGGTQERWMCKFTSSVTFDVYGEFSGRVTSIAVNIVDDCSPINPATNEPYFTILASGWGAGWSTGNVLRFNTIAANRPVWVARTILQSEVYSGTDEFCIEIRGDVDTP